MDSPGDRLDVLARIGTPDGPALDEALRLFARARTTPDEGRAIEILLARNSYAPLPEALLAAVGAALVDRGEREAALRALAWAGSPEAAMLRAELRERAGDLEGALAEVERVLLRDIDWPGARERHARWSEALGIARPAARAGDAGATLAAAAQEVPFRIVREAARGGAGVVYEAQDADLGRRVALKVYHRPDRDRAQLLHETRVAVSLAGPGVVRVFDVDPGRAWIAMEWAKLGSLRALIQSRDCAALAPVARWAIPLARALARVHAAGIVHDDVKPANVLLRAHGDPILSDFGIARPVGAASAPGSLGYVSPERLAGAASAPRDDVFGFGRVLQDALELLADPEQTRLWGPVASICTGSDAARPADGGALVRRCFAEGTASP